jgi:hypothetical protein
MGNVRGDAEFFEHFDFLIAQLRRVMMPGRDVSFHCMDMPASKERDGYIGLKDFPGEPAARLREARLHLPLRGDDLERPGNGDAAHQGARPAAQERARERGDVPAGHPRLPHHRAHARRAGPARHARRLPGRPVAEGRKPVWMDINPSDTLQYRSAREHDDERHICPLQLEVIRRGVVLWTNPGDIVLSALHGHRLGGLRRAGAWAASSSAWS